MKRNKNQFEIRDDVNCSLYGKCDLSVTQTRSWVREFAMKCESRGDAEDINFTGASCKCTIHLVIIFY